jgi:5'-3' exonuclease
MDIHLVDGTYELFRHYFAAAPPAGANGNEFAAVRGVMASVLGMIEAGATHVGIATDHVIESFRNELYPGYKTAEGVPEPLLAQFPVLEGGVRALGITVWPMVLYEADDALASAAGNAARDERVARVWICTPDKDLAQCVAGTRVVQFDRMRKVVRDEAGVIAKWGVRPESIPDYLAVVGDSADGYPGLPGWGAKAAALTLSQFPHLENIPADWRKWNPAVRGAKRLAAVLGEQWNDALLYRTLATLRLDVPVFEFVDDLQWKGPAPECERFCQRIGAPNLYDRAVAAVKTRAAVTTA